MSQNTFSTPGSLFSFSKSKKLIARHVLQSATMTNNLSARNDRNNDSSLQVDQQCFCVRFGLGTCVGKHAFELLAFIGRACVGALTMFTLAGMAPGCIWAHRPHSTLLALIYRLPCNLELC